MGGYGLCVGPARGGAAEEREREGKHPLGRCALRCPSTFTVVRSRDPVA